jgi:RNA polymerase sigma factor (sigma-70 family)
MENRVGKTRATLIQRLQLQNDEQAWEEFIEVYSRYIYGIIRKLGVSAQSAEELSQAILVKLWEKLPDYKFLPEIAKFRTWLFRVIYNSVVSHKRKLNKEMITSEITDEVEVKPEINEIMELEWEKYIANIAWEKVKPMFSGSAIQVFELSIEGKSSEEISEQLGLKLNTVYKLRNRFKDKLAKQIEYLRQDLT